MVSGSSSFSHQERYTLVSILCLSSVNDITPLRFQLSVGNRTCSVVASGFYSKASYADPEKNFVDKITDHHCKTKGTNEKYPFISLRCAYRSA